MCAWTCVGVGRRGKLLWGVESGKCGAADNYSVVREQWFQ